MRIGAAILSALLMSPAAVWAQQSQESDIVMIGPWEIQVTYKAGKFDNCVMSRTVGDITVAFVRPDDGLALALFSPKWKLEQGKSYPVQLVVGSLSVEAKATAETTKNVSIVLADKKLIEGIRIANQIEVQGAGSTIRVPLEKSAMAMDRLEACFEKNSRTVETNPFVAPSRKP